jgi:sulfur-carrier protein adenylyltransferase/sulfurtransferase
VMATEAVKLICGIGEPLVGRLLVVDALGARWRTLAVQAPVHRQPVAELTDDEVSCGVPPVETSDGEIDVRTLAAMLAARAAGEDDFVLVDVREPHELEIVRVPGAVGVPLAQVEAHPDVLGRLSGTDGRRVVLVCKTGARSARALAVLRAAGRDDAVHVAGGLLAWVREIEPDKPVY